MAPLVAQVAQAQPPVKAEVAPQPVEKIKKPRVKKPQAEKKREPQQDALVKNFEALFGRKLTEDESTQLQKATAERQAALRAAQDAWRAQFFKITGVTEVELKQKQKEERKKNMKDRKGKAPDPAAPADPVAPDAKPLPQPLPQENVD